MPPTQAQGGAPTQAQLQMQAISANMQARKACVAQGMDMTQNIYTLTSTGGPGTVVNVPLRNVGLVKRFWIEVQATVSGTSAGPTHTLCPFGPGNFFSQIVLTDLNNQQRINTAGWHLGLISSFKRRNAFGAAFTSDSPLGFGNNFTKLMSAPASITASIGASNLFAMWEVPCSYTDTDLRGAIYANLNQATWNLQMTVNPNAFVTNAADPTVAVYQSSSTTVATLPSFTVTVYQNYLDQLPVGKNGYPILPGLDLSTAYIFNTTSFAGLVQNQDNQFMYANMRDFMSTIAIFDNAGALNAGTDINYWAIQSANYTNIVKYDANLAAFLSRLIINDDPPKGVYYFDHRTRPIATNTYGNMGLVLNPSTISSATASILIGYEMLALINAVSQAGALPST